MDAILGDPSSDFMVFWGFILSISTAMKLNRGGFCASTSAGSVEFRGAFIATNSRTKATSLRLLQNQGETQHLYPQNGEAAPAKKTAVSLLKTHKKFEFSLLTILAFRLKRLCWSQRRQTVPRMPGRTFPSVATSPVKFAASICVNGVTSTWSSFINMSQISPKRIALAYWPAKLTKKLHFQFCPAVRFSRLHNCVYIYIYIYSNIAMSSPYTWFWNFDYTYLTWTLSADLEDIERCEVEFWGKSETRDYYTIEASKPNEPAVFGEPNF